MSKQTISALQCPACSGPVQIGNSMCPSCGVHLAFNYDELFGVKNYTMAGRDVMLDAVLLGHLHAAKGSVEIEPAISNLMLVIHVRHKITRKLVVGGYIESLQGGKRYHFFSKTIRSRIEWHEKLSHGRIYLLGDAYGVEFSHTAEGESELGDIPDVQKWVKEVINASLPLPEVKQVPPKRTWNPTTWFSPVS